MYRVVTARHTQSMKWYHLQITCMTLEPHFKVILFLAQLTRNRLSKERLSICTSKRKISNRQSGNTLVILTELLKL